MSRVVATVGAFPGAGATTVVTALGSALAEQRSHVALVDASAEGSRIADVLPLEGDGEVADALRRRADLSDVQAEGPHDLRAFPAAPETNWAAVRPGAVATAYDRLRERFEFVLVDCGSDLTPASAAWIGYADELVVVSCPDVTDVADDVSALGAAFDVPVRGVVANRVVPDERGETRDAIEASPHQGLAVLPEDPTVDAAATERRSVLVHEPDSQIASCAWEFARRFREDDHAEPVVPDAWRRLDENAAGTSDGDDVNVDDAGVDDTAVDDASIDGASVGDAEVDSASTGGTSTGAADTGAASTGATSDEPTTADGESASSQPATPDGGSGTAAASGSAAADDAAVDEETADDADTGFEWSSSEDLDGDDGSDDTASSTSSLGADIGADLAGSDDEDASADGTSADRGSVADGGRESGASDTGSTLDGNAAGDGSTDDGYADEDADDATEISDEEIEEVFKETMQQAKEQRDAKADAEDADEDDDSVLGGFMGN